MMIGLLHEGKGAAAGFLAGLQHPISGLDHILAMVAVGLWESGVTYSVGFMISTGLLHAASIAIGLVHRWRTGAKALRLAGAAISLAGVWFLWSALR